VTNFKLKKKFVKKGGTTVLVKAPFHSLNRSSL